METLSIKKRDTKIDNDTLRSDGVLPAVYYGRSTDSTPISVDTGDFIHLVHAVGESSIFKIEDEDGNEREALIQDIQIHPVTDRPLHVDFYVIEEGQTITMDLPIELVGEAPAVKNLGGTLVSVVHSLEVEAEPSKLPQNIEVDVSSLEDFEIQITVKDIEVPDGVEILADPDTTIALVSEPTEEEEEEVVEEIDLEDIEVEGREAELEEGEEAPEGEREAEGEDAQPEDSEGEQN